MDFLRRDPAGQESEHGAQPIIQISYPALEHGASAVPERGQISAPRMALGVSPHTNHGVSELSAEDVTAMWRIANPEGRLLLAALFGGIAPEELHQLRWKHVDLEHSRIDVPGGCPRRLRLTEPLRNELAARPEMSPDAPVFADGLGNPLSESSLDSELTCIAHDAGLRRPEQVTAQVAHFTYAAYLVRQGIRMSELAAVLGRLQAAVSSELIRMAPSGQAKPLDQVNLLYPGLPTS
jgi:integrase